MTTARSWAALAVAALATLGGCSDVESCLQGVDPGCLGSAPDDSGNCRFGLVRSGDGLTCVEPGRDAGPSTPRPDSGTVVPDSGGMPNTCACPSGQACRKDGSCVNLCTPVANPPAARPVLLTCRALDGETDSFARAALAACYQTCAHRAAYCGTTCNPTTECTQLAASTAARLACPTDDQACAIALCERQRDLPCAEQQCPLMAAPNCAGALCSNSCKTAMYNNDGICDDGDPSNAISYACDFGTDCGDCGPRRGTAPARTLDIGDPCADPQQCGGDLYNVKGSTGWCVPVGLTDTYSRCIPDCSNGRSCPAGHECSGIATDEDGDGPLPPMQSEDYNDGTLVFGCFPMQCGG